MELQRELTAASMGPKSELPQQAPVSEAQRPIVHAMRAVAVALMVIALWHDAMALVDQLQSYPPDFASYYAPARAFLASRSVDPYQWEVLVRLNAGHHFVPREFWRFVYPPFALLVELPLAALGFWHAYAVWALLCHLATLCTALLIADAFVHATRTYAGSSEAWSDSRGFPARALASVLDRTNVRVGGWSFPLLPFAVSLLVFAFADPTLQTYRAGQINTVIAALLALAFNALVRRRPVLAGSAVALAAGLKLLPLVFLGYLVARRNWRAVAACLAGLGAIILLPLAVMPAGYYGSYYAELHTGNGDLGAIPNNESLAGLFARIISLARPGHPAAVQLASQLGELVGAALVFFALGLIFVVSREDKLLDDTGAASSQSMTQVQAGLRRAMSGSRHDSMEWIAFAVMVSAFMLATPLVWYHHYEMALIGPLILVAYPLLRSRIAGEAWSRRDTIVTVVSAFSIALMVSALPLGADFAAVNRATLLLMATRPASSFLILVLGLYLLVVRSAGRGIGRHHGRPRTRIRWRTWNLL